jgi:hypothetical protein
MHRVPLRVALTAIVAIVFIARSSSASIARADGAPTCPPGRLAFEGGPDLTFTTPTASVDSRNYGCNPGSAAYDIPAGWLSASDSCACLGAISHVTVTEEFTLAGIAAGTLVAFDARCHLVGALEFWYSNTSNESWLDVGLRADAEGDSAHVLRFAIEGLHPVDVALDVPLVRTAGEPFGIVYNLLAGGLDYGTSASGVARLDFSGLPPGVTIRSCRGYVQGASTPALPSTWGALKSRYR